MKKILYKKQGGGVGTLQVYKSVNESLKDIPEGSEHTVIDTDEVTIDPDKFDALDFDSEGNIFYDENKVKKILKELIKSVIKEQIRTALNDNDDYDDIYDLCLDGPADSTEETAERLAGKTYRKAVKDYRKQLLEDIKDGIITATTEADIINGMPVIVWPL